MELTIAANKGEVLTTPVVASSIVKYKVKKPKDTSRVGKKESHAVTSKSNKFFLKTKRTDEGLDLDIPGMFDELLKAKLIEFLELKCPEEANRSIEPDYFKYYKVLGHPIETCFLFKEKVMDSA
ncbi:hypothetical protein LIER_05561 [Lithospermum erythrorhizon]|uniref:Uncharacterized protein n=1 Tax=Lithospermum erythrorhizon TaxID=34254 RepID=A0AAV3P286_LITER